MIAMWGGWVVILGAGKSWSLRVTKLSFSLGLLFSSDVQIVQFPQSHQLSVTVELRHSLRLKTFYHLTSRLQWQKHVSLECWPPPFGIPALKTHFSLRSESTFVTVITLLDFHRRHINSDGTDSSVGRLDGSQKVVLGDSKSHCTGLTDEHSMNNGMVGRTLALLHTVTLTSTTLVKSAVSEKRQWDLNTGKRYLPTPGLILFCRLLGLWHWTQKILTGSLATTLFLKWYLSFYEKLFGQNDSYSMVRRNGWV